MRFLTYDHPDNPTAVVLRHLTTGHTCCSGSDPRRFCADCQDAVKRIVAPEATPHRRAVSVPPDTDVPAPPSVSDFLTNRLDPAPPPPMPGRNEADPPPDIADVLRDQLAKGVRG